MGDDGTCDVFWGHAALVHDGSHLRSKASHGMHGHASTSVAQNWLCRGVEGEGGYIGSKDWKRNGNVAFDPV